MSQLELLHIIRAAVDQAIGDHHEARIQKQLAEYWEKKYNDLLNDSIKASEETAMGMLQLALHQADQKKG